MHDFVSFDQIRLHIFEKMIYFFFFMTIFNRVELTKYTGEYTDGMTFTAEHYLWRQLPDEVFESLGGRTVAKNLRQEKKNKLKAKISAVPSSTSNSAMQPTVGSTASGTKVDETQYKSEQQQQNASTPIPRKQTTEISPQSYLIAESIALQGEHSADVSGDKKRKHSEVSDEHDSSALSKLQLTEEMRQSMTVLRPKRRNELPNLRHHLPIHKEKPSPKQFNVTWTFLESR